MRSCRIGGHDREFLTRFVTLPHRQASETRVQHGILINGSTFWVVHRSRVHGPFDYEWSTDLRGVEFLYQGAKFGEYCSADELYADLAEFKLPRRVCEVASIVIATIVRDILAAVGGQNRAENIAAQLTAMRLEQFATVEQVELTR